MKATEEAGSWEEQKNNLKRKFAALTDNDLIFAKGKKEEMLERLQIKFGKTKEELNRIIAPIVRRDP